MAEKTPMRTSSQYVRASEAKLLSAGGARISTVLPPESVAALDALVNVGYAASRAAVIRRALRDAYQALHSARLP